MEIEYFTKNVYGNELMYVKDDEQRKLLCALTKTLTIDERQMGVVTDLFGVKWVEVLAPKKA